MKRLMGDPGYVDGVLRRGADKANAIASTHLREVQDLVGFLRP
jgi:tryptophanyl-tRNA synthetase